VIAVKCSICRDFSLIQFDNATSSLSCIILTSKWKVNVLKKEKISKEKKL